MYHGLVKEGNLREGGLFELISWFSAAMLLAFLANSDGISFSLHDY